MATLETQYRNYMESNPTAEFTFEEWKKWWGDTLHNAFTEMNLKKSRESIVNKLNTQSEFELSKDEITYIVENWLSTHAQHRMNYVELSCDVNANISINRETIFKN
jgi:hypothetical protein